MAKLLSTLLLLCCFTIQASQPLQKIVFGSCAKEWMEQPVWQAINKENPELFLFIGDNQYADVEVIDGDWNMAPVTDVAVIKQAYQALGAKPGFKKLRETTPVMATWDDHDYGANDAGKEYPLKEASQQAFLDFFGFAQDAPLREQAGIYHSKTFGPKGQRLQVIMLDTRYHRDPIVKNPDGRPKGKGPYIASSDKSASILGSEQWKWLEQQLKQPAEIRLIVSSIQVVAYEHAWEAWGTMPHERQRLYDLIAKTDANGVFFISGDRHLMEISQDHGQTGSKVPYRMWDFTSSGMTDKVREVNEANIFRVGPVYRGTNFGVIEIDWAEDIDHSQIHFISKDVVGTPITRQTIILGDLSSRPVLLERTRTALLAREGEGGIARVTEARAEN